MTISDKKSRGHMHSPEENKAIIRKFIDGYNSRNLDVFEELVAPNYFDHLFQQRGRDKFKEKCGCGLKLLEHIPTSGISLEFLYHPQAIR
jgi:hypothetical protein